MRLRNCPTEVEQIRCWHEQMIKLMGCHRDREEDVVTHAETSNDHPAYVKTVIAVFVADGVWVWRGYGDVFLSVENWIRGVRRV